MENIKKLSSEEKLNLLSQLMDDDDTRPFIEAELQTRLHKALRELDSEIEKYILQIDQARAKEVANAWSTSEERIKAEGRAEVLSNIRYILNKIHEDSQAYAANEEKGRTILEEIHRAKNRIVDNQLSNRARGTRAYFPILKYEGMLADTLEYAWKDAFLLGVSCRNTIPDNVLEKLEKQKRNDFVKLCSGVYDTGRVVMAAFKAITMTDEEWRMKQMENIIPLNPDKHPEIIDFLKNYR